MRDPDDARPAGRKTARSPNKREIFHTLREVKDTPKNYKDILRWADVVGHTIEERRSE